MLQRFSILLGVFVVMALSNAVVPVLPAFAEGATLQGAVYAAYFFGAFVTVLPAGIASDRIGRVPLIRSGLLLTLLSGVLILLFPSGLPLLAFRVVEGIGAGLFVSAALAWTNSHEAPEQLSGYFMAALNLGLVLGLLGTGWLDAVLQSHLAGIALFTALSIPALALGFFVREAGRTDLLRADLPAIVRNYIWLFVAAVVLVGVTGAIAAIYPEYTGRDPSLLSLQLATINIATIITVLVAPRLKLEPVPTIQVSALLMAVAILGSYFTPYALPFIGGFAGVVIVAQLSFLARTNIKQGVMTGLFNTATYAGFTFLAFFAGLVAESTGFLASFLVLAGIVAAMTITIGRCHCEFRG
jgi:MFS family permease